MRPRGSYSSPLCLSFLTHEMGIMKVWVDACSEQAFSMRLLLLVSQEHRRNQSITSRPHWLTSFSVVSPQHLFELLTQQKWGTQEPWGSMVHSSNKSAGVNEVGCSDRGLHLTPSFPTMLTVPTLKTRSKKEKNNHPENGWHMRHLKSACIALILWFSEHE